MARLLKRAQPRLFDYALGLCDKARVRELLDTGKPLLHVSQRYPAGQGCIAPVAVVAPIPRNPNGVLCFDLRQDPAILLDLSVDELRTRLFTAVGQLPDGVERIPLKGIKVNAAPVLAPMKTLTPEAAARWDIDPDRVAAHARRIAGHEAALAVKLAEVYGKDGRTEPTDPDLMLYSGGFFSDRDRRTMQHLRTLTPQELADEHPRFDDCRLPTMLFRMRARSWPETLNEAEREDWDAWRFERLTDPDAGGSLTIDTYEQRIGELREERAEDHGAQVVLDALEQWGEQVMDAAV